MKITGLVLSALMMTGSSVALAQVGTAITDTGKAAAQSTMEAGDKAKAAVSSEPNKSLNQGKAQVHKGKAHLYRHHAKAAAKAAAQ